MYCSPACRRKYGATRQPDPTKQITFTCGTCGKEVTRWKGYGSTVSGKRFCSNQCAARHTKTVKHYVSREMDMVLDSTWEMLFAGLCGWHKIAVARLDRAEAIEWEKGHWYAPDFVLVDQGLAVEVKGHEDAEDQGRWDAWREQVGPLTVVDQELLNTLRLAPTAKAFLLDLASA